jgi:hypothetical protein
MIFIKILTFLVIDYLYKNFDDSNFFVRSLNKLGNFSVRSNKILRNNLFTTECSLGFLNWSEILKFLHLPLNLLFFFAEKPELRFVDLQALM